MQWGPIGRDCCAKEAVIAFHTKGTSFRRASCLLAASCRMLPSPFLSRHATFRDVCWRRLLKDSRNRQRSSLEGVALHQDPFDRGMHPRPFRTIPDGRETQTL